MWYGYFEKKELRDEFEFSKWVFDLRRGFEESNEDFLMVLAEIEWVCLQGIRGVYGCWVREIEYE